MVAWNKTGASSVITASSAAALTSLTFWRENVPVAVDVELSTSVLCLPRRASVRLISSHTSKPTSAVSKVRISSPRDFVK